MMKCHQTLTRLKRTSETQNKQKTHSGMATFTFFDAMVDFSIQHFTNPFLWLDKKGKILRVNQTACQQFDYESTLFETLSIFYIFPTINIVQWNKYLKRLSKESTFTMEIPCLSQSDLEFNASIKLSEITLGAYSYIFINFLDFPNQQAASGTANNKPLMVDDDWMTRLGNHTFNLVKEMVLWVQPNGQIFMANEAMSKKLGYTKEELQQMYVWDFSTEFPTLAWEPHWESLKKEKYRRIESEWKSKENFTFPIDLSLHFVTVEGREYINAIAHNIEKKKEREDLMKMTYQTLNNSSDVIVWSKKNGEIIYFNEAVTKLLGYETQEFEKMTDADLVVNYNIQERTKANSLLAANKSIKGEVTLRKKDGGIVIMEQRSALFTYQNEKVTCTIFRDITAKKAREDRLRELLSENQELRLELEGEVSYLQEEIQQEHGFKDIVTISPKYKKVLDLVQQVANSDTTVLLLGETGTGKELLARAIHARSNRSDKPLIKINCGALPENLIESELFGHERGAYTGADKLKKGKFELADNGTIFLDEIGEMPLPAQVKLLRVLQESEFTRLGGSIPITVDTRIIAATNRDLKAMITQRTFREDLYYRLNVFPITNLPLRERKEDIPALVTHFMQKYSSKRARKVTILPSRSKKKLMAYDFPGNIRELENIVERAVILSNSKYLSLQHWDLPKGKNNQRIAMVKSFEEVQKDHIIEVLNLTKGKVSGAEGAAEILQMNGKTLDSKMRKFGIQRGDFIQNHE